MMHGFQRGSILKPTSRPGRPSNAGAWLKHLLSTDDPTTISAPSIGRHQQHAVALIDQRAQVASERRSVDVEQPPRREFAIVDTKLCENRKLVLELHQHFLQTISVERDTRGARAAPSNSKEFHRN